MSSSQNIEFIEGASFKAVPAPLSKRFVAFMIDLGIVSTIQSFVLIAFVFIFGIFAAIIGAAFGTLGKQFQDMISGSFGIKHILVILLALILGIIIYALVFGVTHGYFIYYEYKKKTTKGKEMMGLSIISTESTLTLRQCFIREMMRWIECPLLLPALISMASTKRHQRLGDLMAGTVVVYSASKEKSSNFLYLPIEEYRIYSQEWGRPSLLKSQANLFLRFAFSSFIYSASGKPNINKLNEALKLQKFYPDLLIETLPDDKLEKLLRYHAQYCIEIFPEDKS